MQIETRVHGQCLKEVAHQVNIQDPKHTACPRYVNLGVRSPAKVHGRVTPLAGSGAVRPRAAAPPLPHRSYASDASDDGNPDENALNACTSASSDLSVTAGSPIKQRDRKEWQAIPVLLCSKPSALIRQAPVFTLVLAGMLSCMSTGPSVRV